MNSKTSLNPFEIMSQVLDHEALALNRAKGLLQAESCEQLLEIFRHLTSFDGQLFFSGVGKSYLIGQKLAATFSSLGLPSHVLHPVEALHGDLGRLRPQDGIVFLSKSATTKEILEMVPYLSIEKSRRIGLLGKIDTPLAAQLGLVFDCSVEKEACLNNQAPTTSSTTALAMGDAMAVLYEAFIGLSKEKFAYHHPGGFLGKSLLLKVKDVMTPADQCPHVGPQETLKEVILKMTEMNVGGCVVEEKSKFSGIIVEGDIRRTLLKDEMSLSSEVKTIMNPNPISIGPEEKAYAALELMEKRQNKLNILPVVEGEKFLGFIRTHDLLQRGLTLSVQEKS